MFNDNNVDSIDADWCDVNGDHNMVLNVWQLYIVQQIMNDKLSVTIGKPLTDVNKYLGSFKDFGRKWLGLIYCENHWSLAENIFCHYKLMSASIWFGVLID